MFEDELFRGCRLGHRYRGMMGWEEMACKKAKKMDGRAPREDIANKNTLSCFPQCRLRHQWDGDTGKDRKYHWHTRHNTAYAHSSLIIAYWAARPDALGSRASVANGKGCQASPKKKSLKTDQSPEKSREKSLNTQRGNTSHLVAASLNAGFDFHLYNGKYCIWMPNQGNYRYLLSKSCHCHSWQVQSRCYSDSVMVLFWRRVEALCQSLQ